LIVFNNELYFSAYARRRRELWKVDATGVTRNVANLVADSGSSDPAA